MEEFVVPKDNRELYERYAEFVSRHVKRHDTVGVHFEDMLQAIWLRLLEADILGKFNASLNKLPETLSGEEAAQYIGVTWSQWRVSQWRTFVGKTNWAPRPVVGEYYRRDARWNRTDVEAVASRFKKHAGIKPPVFLQAATRGRFEAYLSVAVSNAFKNFCRTLRRKNRDLYLPPDPDGGAWEARLVDSRVLPDEVAAACEMLEPYLDNEAVINSVADGRSLADAVNRHCRA